MVNAEAAEAPLGADTTPQRSPCADDGSDAQAAADCGSAEGSPRPPSSPLGVDVDLMDVDVGAEEAALEVSTQAVLQLLVIIDRQAVLQLLVIDRPPLTVCLWLQWLRSPVSSPVSEPNRVELEQRARTLVVLDFDDTLFPTTELRRLGYATTVQEELPDHVMAEVTRIETQALRLVEKCSQFGQVVLLTNAEGRWLKLATSSYMPRLEQALERVSRTVFGRHYSASAPDDPGMWKELAFRDNLYNLRSVIGDDPVSRLRNPILACDA